MISVVIPLYNKARHVRRAIDSVLDQAYQHFEIVVVDDGSTDGGADVVRQFADHRIRLIVQENAGVSAARNRGIQEASQDFIAFLDADDQWLPVFLETVVGLHERHPDAGIFATAYRLSRGHVNDHPAFRHCPTEPQGGLLPDYFRASLGPPPVWSSAVMIPKPVLIEVGGFPVGVKRGEDLQTWARIALRYRVAWSPVEGAMYHLSSDNRITEIESTNSDLPGAIEIEAAIAKGDNSLFSCEMAAEYLVSWRLTIALNCYLHGRRACAMDLLRRTRNTTLFTKRRRLLTILFSVPPFIIKLARHFRNIFRPQPARHQTKVASSGHLNLRDKLLALFAGDFNAERFWNIRTTLASRSRTIKRVYYQLAYRKCLNKYNAFIPITTTIESQPIFPHGISGIHISEHACIGRNCLIFHHVTIGSTEKGAPRIGNDCFIGCGAIIIGNVKIGDNVRIGANCTVVCDIPDNSTVVMPKARIISSTRVPEIC